MSDSDTKPADGQPDRPEAPEMPTRDGEVDAAPNGAPAEPSAGAEGSANERVAQAEAEVLKVREQLLRTAADFDNYRKRARKDVEDASRKSLEKTLLEVLPVADNLERAVAAAQQAGDMKAVIEGVNMVLNFFADALSRLGVERVESVGKAFDPSLHEAVQQVEDNEKAGQVVSELTPGYRLGERLLRAAMVVVAKPRASAAPPPASDSGAV